MVTQSEQQAFSSKIEELADTLYITHIEAVVHYCEKTGTEVEVAAKLVSSDLKKKIAKDAKKLNMLR